MNIKELVNIKEEGLYPTTALLTKLEQATTSTNKPYTIASLQDEFGAIEARKWDIDMIGKCEVGKVYALDLQAKEFNGKMGFTIKNIEIVEGADASKYTGDFTPDTASMKKYINDIIANIIADNTSYKVIFDKLFGYDDELFWEYPGAKGVHHDLRHGLLFHTTSMLKHAKALIATTQEMYSLKVDENLVYTAIILHDFFKIKEYSVNEVYKGDLTKFVLVGHISMSAQFVGSLYFNHDIEEELYLNLSHIILSHHGKLEYGSPVVPSTIEAQIVHSVDLYDSRMYIFKNETRRLEQGQMANDKSYTLGCNVYLPNEEDMNPMF